MLRNGRVMTAIALLVGVAGTTAGCSDGESAIPTEAPAVEQTTMQSRASAPRGPASTPGLLRGYKQVIDLTQTLDENTPVIQLPAPFANSPGYSRELISAFDALGPAWKWFHFTVGEHTGTHFDAPCHWISGRDKACVDEIPPGELIGPAVVIDVREQAAADADYLVTIDDVRDYERGNGRIPAGAWVILQTGWADRYHDAAAYLNGGHWPGPAPDLTQFLINERDIRGIGVETVGTDAGIAAGFDPAFPNHFFMLGSGRFGLTSLTNVDQLPPRGALLIAAPMKLREGTGSPVRVLALVP